MFKMKRTVVWVAVGVAAPLFACAPAQAYAGTPGCVTVTENRSVTNGMSQAQVATRFGTRAKPVRGSVTFRWDSTYNKEIDREYRICDSVGKPRSLDEGSVEVWFEKDADWDTGDFPPGPLLSTHKTRWSS